MLPSFSWIIPDRLCAGGLPGLLEPVAEDMTWLRDHGIELVVTLTERPLEPDPEAFGMRGVHFPIPDMGISTPRAAAPVCREILASMAAGQAVLVHCRGGLGRTGLILACTLVARGQEPKEALSLIRGIRPTYVQTGAQERFITHFAEHLANEASSA